MLRQVSYFAFRWSYENHFKRFFDQGGKGGEKARERHVSKGKLLPRDRIKYLLDPK
jgi:acetyl-CoA carboxylase carboxyltransferase component